MRLFPVEVEASLSFVQLMIGLSVGGPSNRQTLQSEQFAFQSARERSHRRFNWLVDPQRQSGVHTCLHLAHKGEAKDTCAKLCATKPGAQMAGDGLCMPRQFY